MLITFRWCWFNQECWNVDHIKLMLLWFTERRPWHVHQASFDETASVSQQNSNWPNILLTILINKQSGRKQTYLLRVYKKQHLCHKWLMVVNKIVLHWLVWLVIGHNADCNLVSWSSATWHFVWVLFWLLTWSSKLWIGRGRVSSVC